MRLRIQFWFVLFLILAGLLLGCGSEPDRESGGLLPCENPLQYCFDYTGSMKDRSILNVRIHLLFRDEAGVREGRIREKRMAQGLDLVLKDY